MPPPAWCRGGVDAPSRAAARAIDSGRRALAAGARLPTSFFFFFLDLSAPAAIHELSRLHAYRDDERITDRSTEIAPAAAITCLS